MNYVTFCFDVPDPYIEYSVGNRTEVIELVYVEGRLRETGEYVNAYIIEEQDPEIPSHVMESIYQQESEFDVNIYPASSVEDVWPVEVM